ncbi:hypothetical protein Q9R34_19285 [Enterobacter sp. BRE11]|nr:hypothetical protein [Enterobacter sp. BRE11]
MPFTLLITHPEKVKPGAARYELVHGAEFVPAADLTTSALGLFATHAEFVPVHNPARAFKRLVNLPACITKVGKYLPDLQCVCLAVSSPDLTVKAP